MSREPSSTSVHDFDMFYTKHSPMVQIMSGISRMFHVHQTWWGGGPPRDPAAKSYILIEHAHDSTYFLLRRCLFLLTIP